ncbi:hypothetical protein OG936_37375 [Streptomyces sp. NBC_00846]|uniref:hypothetical protein n=1 Tax=Streptomyces sp. NBC_00846 TaxID=2975849 RepID=UPI00386CA997|nr:hypothetical protein OG936_37375 [Streptomyces sp. NBC_00846]
MLDHDLPQRLQCGARWSARAVAADAFEQLGGVGAGLFEPGGRAAGWLGWLTRRTCRP